MQMSDSKSGASTFFGNSSLNTDIQLRPFPYPYRAMLVICSDLDETPDRNVYWQIMRFLNTTEMTAMGPGVGLEVGNSIYFDIPPDRKPSPVRLLSGLGEWIYRIGRQPV